MYLLYLLIILFSFYYISHSFKKSDNNLFVIFWLSELIILGTWGYFSDDYNSYVEIIESAYAQPYGNIHIEQFWIGLAEICKGQIIPFRLVSFLCIALFIILNCKAYKIEYKYFVCYYSLLCLSSHICWIRQPLSMLVFLLGFKNIINRHILIGLGLLILSFFLHKTTFVFIALFGCVIFPINKKNIYIYLLGALILFLCFSAFLKLDLPYASFIIYYLESEGEFESRNIIFTILQNLIIIMQCSLVLVSVYKYHLTTNNEIKYLIRFSFGLVIVALTIMAVPYETGVIYKRIIAMAMLSNVIILSKELKSDIYKIKNLSVLIPIIFIVMLGFTYTLANNYSNISKLLEPFV